MKFKLIQQLRKTVSQNKDSSFGNLYQKNGASSNKSNSSDDKKMIILSHLCSQVMYIINSFIMNKNSMKKYNELFALHYDNKIPSI
jgi:hypothetical protein